MTGQRTRRTFLGGIGTVAVGGAGYVVGKRNQMDNSDPTEDVIVFHAGSLAPPFAAAEPTFEEDRGVDVIREPKGSVASTKKITEQGRTADVLGVSDFRLLRNRIVPEYGDWYAIFATNALSIQYREDSQGAEDFSTDNWWEVLSRNGVTIGHADPAVDPGGYRAVMAQQLGAIPFDGERLYDDTTYRKLRENSVVPTGTETKLRGQLESGKLDYAIYYRSISATTDMPWIELQPKVDLSKATDEYADHYSKASVETDAGTFTGAPIAYGLTVPSVAESPAFGARWIEHFATNPGRKVLEDAGLQPVSPIVVPDSGDVPESVSQHAQVQQNLGPLAL